jgi:hypothetical protein
VIATGPVGQIAPLVVADDLTPPAAGKTKVRVLHLSPDTPAVDVALAGGPVLVRGLAFRDVTPYLEVDAGSYSFEVRPAGTTTVALGIPNAQLGAGNIASVAAIGFLNETPALRAQAAIDARSAQPAIPAAPSDPLAQLLAILQLAAAR